MKQITELHTIQGKRVLVRGSLNVSIQDGQVMNDFRLRTMLPTLEFLRDQGAKIVLCGHIGRESHETLQPVYAYLQKHFSCTFSKEIVGEAVEKKVDNLGEGEILLLENLRQHEGEVSGDTGFVQALASLADIYVNDAFAASHRAHASIVGVAKLLPAYAGVEFVSEIQHLSQALQPAHPFVCILGGAKFKTKLPLIEKFVSIADTIFVGGALANDFFAARGYGVGTSLVSDEPIDTDLLTHPCILLPTDVTVKSPRGEEIKKPDGVGSDEKILDAGPETIAVLTEKIKSAKLVLWNGPLGRYEDGFFEHNEALAKIIAQASAASIVGGGDTIASIARLGLETDFTFLSTAGGAMIDFLASGTLPGIQALEE